MDKKSIKVGNAHDSITQSILPKINKPGRKRLAEKDTSSKRVVLLLTPSEFEHFEACKPYESIPNSTFLKGFLLKNTDLLITNK